MPQNFLKWPCVIFGEIRVSCLTAFAVAWRGYVSMAGKLLLQNRNKLGDIFSGWFLSYSYSKAYGRLPGNKSCYRQLGEELKNRVV